MESSRKIDLPIPKTIPFLNADGKLQQMPIEVFEKKYNMKWSESLTYEYDWDKQIKKINVEKISMEIFENIQQDIAKSWKKIAVYDTGGAGLGVRAISVIPRGTLLGIYPGKLWISDTPQDDKITPDKRYVLSTSIPNQSSKKYVCVDAEEGNIFRYLNAAPDKNPRQDANAFSLDDFIIDSNHTVATENVGTELIWDASHEKFLVGLTAKETIKSGEPLSLHYGARYFRALSIDTLLFDKSTGKVLDPQFYSPKNVCIHVFVYEKNESLGAWIPKEELIKLVKEKQNFSIQAKDNTLVEINYDTLEKALTDHPHSLFLKIINPYSNVYKEMEKLTLFDKKQVDEVVKFSKDKNFR